MNRHRIDIRHDHNVSGKIRPFFKTINRISYKVPESVFFCALDQELPSENIIDPEKLCRGRSEYLNGLPLCIVPHQFSHLFRSAGHIVFSSGLYDHLTKMRKRRALHETSCSDFIFVKPGIILLTGFDQTYVVVRIDVSQFFADEQNADTSNTEPQEAGGSGDATLAAATSAETGQPEGENNPNSEGAVVQNTTQASTATKYLHDPTRD